MQMQIFIYLFCGASSKERYYSCSLSSEIKFLEASDNLNQN